MRFFPDITARGTVTPTIRGSSRSSHPPPSSERAGRSGLLSGEPHELAHVVFGAVSDMGMISTYHRGDMRGLLRLEVPFDDLEVHRAREARFMAAVSRDPLLSTVSLVYVIGPNAR